MAVHERAENYPTRDVRAWVSAAREALLAASVGALLGVLSLRLGDVVNTAGRSQGEGLGAIDAVSCHGKNPGEDDAVYGALVAAEATRNQSCD